MSATGTRVRATIERVFPQIPGWMTREKGERVASLCVESQTCAKTGERRTGLGMFVEIGVFGGRGIVAMGLAVKECLDGIGLVTGYDPYSADASLEGVNSAANDEWWSKLDYGAIEAGARATLTSLGLDAIAQIHKRKSRDAAQGWRAGAIDVLHVDGNHSVETSCEDVVMWSPLVRPGGYLVLDDTDWESTKPAQRLLALRGFTRVEDHGAWAVFRAP